MLKFDLGQYNLQNVMNLGNKKLRLFVFHFHSVLNREVLAGSELLYSVCL